MNIKNTPLYLSIAPYLSESDQKEFARMLDLAPGAKLQAKTIDAAFTWSITPQGQCYWESLSCRLYKAGSPAGSNWANDHFKGKDRQP